MKLATTTRDLAGYCRDRSIASPVELFEGTGFRYLDLSFYDVIYPGSPWIAPGDAWKKETEDAGEKAKKYGLSFCQSHAPSGEHFAPGEKRDALLLAVRRVIEACGILGIPDTVIHASGKPGMTPEDFAEKNAGFYRLFADDAEKHGVDILAENSARAWNPTYYLFSGRDMREFVRRAGIPRLHLCWDTGHANVEARDQYTDILDMGNEMRAVHLQDNFGSEDTHMMPFAGTVNFDRVLRGMRDTGYRGAFTFEAVNLLRPANARPCPRRDAKEDDILREAPLAIRREAERLLYDTGRWMLEKYGIAAE